MNALLQVQNLSKSFGGFTALDKVEVAVGKGERFGWCFRWNHNDARELQGAQPSFEKVLAALTSGIERRDPTVLRFFGIHSE